MKKLLPFLAIVLFYCSGAITLIPLFYVIGNKTLPTFLQYILISTPAHLVMVFLGPRLFRVRASTMMYKPSLSLLATGTGITVILFIVSALLKNLTLSIINWDMCVSAPAYEPLWKKIASLMSSTLISPFFEEFICRGIMLTYLARHYNIFISLLITSVIFTIGHNDFFNAPDLFVFSITLGYVFLKSGSLWTVFLMHALANLLANSSVLYKDLIIHLHVPIVPFALALAVTLVILFLVLKWFGKQEWKPS